MAESLGLSSGETALGEAQRIEYVTVQRELPRILAFARCSLDQLINSPLRKREILGYYKLNKQVERTCEIVDMERAWNSLGVLKF